MTPKRITLSAAGAVHDLLDTTSPVDKPLVFFEFLR